MFCFRGGISLGVWDLFAFWRKSLHYFVLEEENPFFFVLEEEYPFFFYFGGGKALILLVLEEVYPFHLCFGEENRPVFYFQEHFVAELCGYHPKTQLS